MESISTLADADFWVFGFVGGGGFCVWVFCWWVGVWVGVLIYYAVLLFLFFSLFGSYSCLP